MFKDYFSHFAIFVTTAFLVAPVTFAGVVEKCVIAAAEIVDVQSFTHVENLGRGLEAIVLVKSTERGLVLDENMSGTLRISRGGNSGRVATGKLEEILDPAFPSFRTVGPHGALLLAGDRILIVSETSISVFDQKTSEKIVEIEDKKRFHRLHAVSVDPKNSNRILVASSSYESIFEISLSEKKIVWEWDLLEHGAATNRFGKDVRLEPGFDRALGLSRQHRVGFPNWVGYQPDTGDILVSFLSLGMVARIDRDTGKMQEVMSDLKKPHGLVPWKNHYFVTDTRRGQVRMLNHKFELVRIFDFTGFALPEGLWDMASEWLQHTLPLSNDLLATVDTRRENLIIWSPFSHTYRLIKIPRTQVLQSIEGADL